MSCSARQNTREISPGDWVTFLREFNGRNYARAVRLAESVPPGKAEPMLARHQTLVGVELDSKGCEAPAMTVALGGLEIGMPHFTHVISHPTRLWVEEKPCGLTVGLTIESKEEGRTYLTFESGDTSD